MLVAQLAMMLVSVRSREQLSVSSEFLDSVRVDEERTACGKLFQTEVAAAEKALAPMVARLVRKMTSANLDDEERSR